MGAGFMTGMDCKTYLSNLQCKGSDRHQKVEELFQRAKGGIYVCICLEECREMKSEMCAHGLEIIIQTFFFSPPKHFHST